MSAAQSSVCRCGWPLDLCYFIRKLEKNKIKSEILLIVKFLTYKMYQTIEIYSTKVTFLITLFGNLVALHRSPSFVI